MAAKDDERAELCWLKGDGADGDYVDCELDISCGGKVDLMSYCWLLRPLQTQPSCHQGSWSKLAL